MFEMLLGNSKAMAIPKGQAQWVTAGTFLWTCPLGVESISCLVVSAGGQSGFSGATPVGGRGGGTRWQNNIPVVPGQVYEIVVGNPGVAGASRPANTNLAASSAFGLQAGLGSAGTPFSDDVKGGYGGNGGYYSVTYATIGTGGFAGLYTNGTTPSKSGSNGTSAAGVSLTADEFSRSGQYGAGAEAIYNGTYITYAATVGAVRIIWGAGRAYPNQGLANQ